MRVGGLALSSLWQGFGQSASICTHGRAPSSMSPVQPGSFDWDTALQGADWFRWSEITPVLGPETPAACAEALTVARRLGAKPAAI